MFDPYLGVFGGYELLNHQLSGQTSLPSHSNMSHFCRVFKKAYGVTPQTLLRRH